MIIPPTTPIIPVVTPIPVAVEPAARADTGNKSEQQNKRDNQSGNHDGEKSSIKQKSSLQLTEQERAEVQKLAQRDREVRAHEAAHKGAAGQYARGAAQFEYERGPDGRQYATGGEVSIDTSKPDDPQAALKKAQNIRRAALAPAQPSAQDRTVAAQATQMAAEAQADLLAEKAENRNVEAEPPAESPSNFVEQTYNNNTEDTPPQVDFTV